MKNDRKTQLFKNEIWEDFEFENLKSGDKFRLFEPDDKEVKSRNGNTEFIATSDASLSIEGAWSMNIIE